MLVILPMFHSGGLFIQVSPCLYKGATLLIHRRFDPMKTYEDISRFRVTKLLGVPTVFRSLMKVDESTRGDMSSLKVCAIGGEKVTPELLDECWNGGFPLRQVMGQTETSILLWASEEESLRKPGTVGRPVFHSEVTLRDIQGRPVGPNKVGEIVVRGSIMMKEYWRDPVQTEQIFAGGWLRTGDLARMDEDGYYYLVDRAKDMYISGGENVYPAEVERVLKQYERVEDAAVIGVPDDRWGEVGCAFVLLKKGMRVSNRTLIAHCRDRLAKYKIPAKIIFCKDLPRTPLGKIRKFLLKPLSED